VGSYSNRILDAVQRIQVILDHALEFNQLESLDAITKPEWWPAHATLQRGHRMAPQAQPDIPTRITNTPGGFEGETMVDTRLFGLAMQNLLSKSISYSNGRAVELELQCAGDLLSVDIIDQRPGTGLGHSIAARAAQASAGELRLAASDQAQRAVAFGSK
jgi:signal transduction histidine kinase